MSKPQWKKKKKNNKAWEDGSVGVARAGNAQGPGLGNHRPIL